MTTLRLVPLLLLMASAVAWGFSELSWWGFAGAFLLVAWATFMAKIPGLENDLKELEVELEVLRRDRESRKAARRLGMK